MSEIEQTVKKALEGLGLANAEFEVHRNSSGSVWAWVQSPDFDGLDDASRQQRVWEWLRTSLDDYDRSQIEYVFTYGQNEEVA